MTRATEEKDKPSIKDRLHICNQCGFEWVGNKRTFGKKPKQCPHCHTLAWHKKP